MKFVIFPSNKWQPNFNKSFTVACIWTKRTQNRASYKFILGSFVISFFGKQSERIFIKDV